MKFGAYEFLLDDGYVPDGSITPLTESQRRSLSHDDLIDTAGADARVCDGGTVYRAKDGREALVLDAAPAARRAEDEFRPVLERSPAIGRSEKVRVDLRWPDEIYIDLEGKALGYFGPALDDSFLHEGVRPRTLAEWVMAQGESLSIERRLALARAVCAWLHGQHRAGLINGQVDSRLILTNEGGSAITPVHYRRLRSFGAGHWNGERADGSFDQDRAGFARIVFLLLAPSGSDPRDWIASDGPVGSLGDWSSSRIRALFRRGLGAPGTMPTMEEWQAALHERGPRLGSATPQSATAARATAGRLVAGDACGRP
ncbi:hypothetical protein [Nocardioides ochotonae]|uniref:hypothetical protein n=1 Tax=Nocardioides ochotonae TaxID=2685869 RepID=UPI00140B67D4|nr:hypothetical protein [Nocardioides ochotonae]